MWRWAICLLFCPLFGELSLYDAECIALKQNKDVLAMRELLHEAEAGRLMTLSRWWPQVEVISRGYKTEKRQFITNSKSAFISQFSATQALISSDRYFDVRIANLVVKQLKRLLEAAIIDTLYEVRTGYYKVVFDYENVATAKEHVDLLKELAQQAEARYRIGTSILLTANQAKVAIANAEATYQAAVKELKVDQDTFAKVLGYNPGACKIDLADRTIPIDQVPKMDVHAGEMAFWERTALLLQPTLQSIKTEVRIAEQQIGQAKGKYWPKLFAEANYGGYATRMLDNPSSSFFNQKFNWAVGLVAEWTLFDGFSRARGVRKARHRKLAKQYEYQRGVQEVYEGVRKEIFEMQEAFANLTSAEANVFLANETVELADNQFKIGYITIFDYQTVVDGYIQALNTRSQARFDLVRSYYGLRHASGADLE